MSDDRFEQAEEAEEVEPHLITALAAVEIQWIDRRWVIVEPALLVREPDSIVCNHGMHLDSAADRARCDMEKERANGATMPTRREIRDAFDRAILAPVLPLRGI